MRRRFPLLAALALSAAPCLAHAGAVSTVEEGAGYTRYTIGDLAAPSPGKPAAGLLLAGGGEWDKDAFGWFVAKAGHGHIVVLRASQGGEAGEGFMNEIGGVTSVETFVFRDRKAAYDPRILSALARADGVYIAGGDQARYVRYWKGTPVAATLDKLARDHPIAGTSAGLAIMGGTGYGCLDGGSATSGASLRDPTGAAVTMVPDFLHLPRMAHVVTDTHFTRRDRLGRLIAFVAKTRVMAGGDPAAIGLGVDEGAAIAVDAQGQGKLYGPAGTYAWLVEPQGKPTTIAANTPLDQAAIRITALGREGAIDMNRLAITGAAFAGTAAVKAGRLTGVPYPAGMTWSLAIHGGAGVAPRGSLTPEQDKAYRAGLSAALAAGSAVLSAGGSSMDAVEAAVRVLEDDQHFNAGRGAVFDAQGVNRLDAAIMDGSTLEAGAIAGVTRTKNPVSLARAVIEHSPHVLLTGDGADAFARAIGVEQVDPAWFRTEQRWQEYLEWKKDNPGLALRADDPAARYATPDPTHRFGTVGAVARDMHGHLAAATSTGGLTGKRWGRIGDSPLIGAGTYAADGHCAMSATGTGEFFIRESAGRQLCDRVDFAHETIREAATDTMDEVAEIGGEGGLIAMDKDGHPAFAMNSEGMYRGTAASDQTPATAIYADEVLPQR